MIEYEALRGMYVIDRQGKGVNAWYDYREGKAENTIRKSTGIE